MKYNTPVLTLHASHTTPRVSQQRSRDRVSNAVQAVNDAVASRRRECPPRSRMFEDLHQFAPALELLLDCSLHHAEILLRNRVELPGMLRGVCSHARIALASFTEAKR